MKTLHPDLFPETLLVNHEGEKVFTTSLKVAEHFNKRHDNVLRDIEKLILEVQECGHSLLRFEERMTTYTTAKNQFREAKMYLMDRKAFSVLTGRFSGKIALLWQLDFYDAFEEMERQLIMQQKRESNALFLLRPKWGPITEHPNWPRKELIKQTGHKSPGSITACRRRMREVGLIN